LVKVFENLTFNEFIDIQGFDRNYYKQKCDVTSLGPEQAHDDNVCYHILTKPLK